MSGVMSGNVSGVMCLVECVYFIRIKIIILIIIIYSCFDDLPL